MTLDLVNLFHCAAGNIGDRMSGPSQYLWPERFYDEPISAGLANHVDGAILGGGQIFNHLKQIASGARKATRKIRLVAWGVGLPLIGTQDASVISASEQYDLFSTRNFDWRHQLNFVPCASCLSPTFEKPQSPQHDFVVYRHQRKPGPVDVPSSIPTMSNAVCNPQAVVDFIASGDTVVTSSYHGVYWAQLIGRRVVCIPYNHKFFTFQHPPTMAEADTWRDAIKIANRQQPLLDEYRTINRTFAAKVERIWND